MSHRGSPCSVGPRPGGRMLARAVRRSEVPQPDPLSLHRADPWWPGGGRCRRPEASSRVFYFGACAGGVWKSDDAGQYWQNVTDGFFTTASIGALAVAPSDGNVIYAGTGESTIRIDVSHGDGSTSPTDAGMTWRHMGLAEYPPHRRDPRAPPRPGPRLCRRARPRIEGQSRARPVPIEGRRQQLGAGAARQRARRRRRRRRSTQQPADPLRHHLAGTAHVLVDRQRRAGQRTVAFARRRRHMDRTSARTPACPRARSARSACPCRRRDRAGCSRSSRPRAASAVSTAPTTSARRGRRLVENPTSAGALVLQHVIADPTTPDDGLRHEHEGVEVDRRRHDLRAVPHPHGDNHALWIDPANPDRMIGGDDGGAWVSFNGGAVVVHDLQPADRAVLPRGHGRPVPYSVYGSQQDNSASPSPARPVSARSTGATAIRRAAARAATSAPKPGDPNIVYVGAIGSSPGGGDRCSATTTHQAGPARQRVAGAVPRRQHRRGPLPVDLPHRLLAPRQQRAVRRRQQGVPHHRRGTQLAGHQPRPDLRRPGHARSSSGPLTMDTAGAEMYATIFSLMVSAHQQGVSDGRLDDGLVHVSHERRWRLEATSRPGPAEVLSGHDDAESPHTRARST